MKITKSYCVKSWGGCDWCSGMCQKTFAMMSMSSLIEMLVMLLRSYWPEMILLCAHVDLFILRPRNFLVIGNFFVSLNRMPGQSEPIYGIIQACWKRESCSSETKWDPPQSVCNDSFVASSEAKEAWIWIVFCAMCTHIGQQELACEMYEQISEELHITSVLLVIVVSFIV